MPTPVFKLNTREFQQTLKKYRGFTRRDVPEIVNTKAFFIARAAVVYTPKADSSKVRAFFGKDTKKIVGMIINKRRGQRGQKGLYGKAMEEAQAMMKAARLRSVAFIKSGWLPAIKTLEKLTHYRRGVQRSEMGAATGRVHQIGAAKGKVVTAKEGGFSAKAIITNLANARHDESGDALENFGGPALQKAIDHETASMKEYIEMKFRDSAKEAGIKTH
jgi:hypothetical protein